jgi:hypothetical protein
MSFCQSATESSATRRAKYLSNGAGRNPRGSRGWRDGSGAAEAGGGLGGVCELWAEAKETEAARARQKREQREIIRSREYRAEAKALASRHAGDEMGGKAANPAPLVLLLNEPLAFDRFNQHDIGRLDAVHVIKSIVRVQFGIVKLGAELLD